MYSRKNWEGSLEIECTLTEKSEECSQNRELDETQQSWILKLRDKTKKNDKYVDLGCVICSWKSLKWILGTLVVAFLVIGMPIIIAMSKPKHKPLPPPIDKYTIALHKALRFFNAQKSGRLRKDNNITWRGDSGLKDGFDISELSGGLVGGYYDGGSNTKFHFPMSFTLTMLSWSLIEYEHKYEAINEFDHIRELIKWGTDYLLLTFNSNKTDKIYSQVGGARNGSLNTPNDLSCWERPEDMDYPRLVQTSASAPDLGAEMAAALASASIVFRDDIAYSTKLIKGATEVFHFASDTTRTTYSYNNMYIEPFYNSTGFWDEYMWGAAWLFYATGNFSYLSLATNPHLPKHSKAFSMNRDHAVLSWDNKLPAAMLLLMRLRIFLNPGYPYEDMLKSYHNITELTMCSYLKRYEVFKWTPGGLFQPYHGRGQPLQYTANAAFLASIYADYMYSVDIQGWYCGGAFIELDVLRSFATSQINYILGENPMKTSYVVGYGNKYPKHVHHRGASIPHDKIKYSCKQGWKWRDTRNPNPNKLIGAMVGGPDQFDLYKDSRTNKDNEPTLAGNVGLVAALVSLTSSGSRGVDKNTIFSSIPPLYLQSPSPPPPWKPFN